ncbi:hypothetical protein [Actinospongicola halichondriae]|uniref:hypothetical protein n=1 Tax=Actinospongicola halichondriae TaxID=3236844 RepID=UPI003D48B46C
MPSQARVLVANGDLDAAVELVERALAALGSSRAPFQRIVLLIESSRLRERRGDLREAEVDAETAVAALADLDVVLDPADRELLDRLSPASGRATTRAASLHRTDKWWTLSLDGTEVRLRDTKGLRYLAELVASPGAERHALDLVDRIEGVGDVDRRAIGDAGAVLDTTARSAYRHRIEALRAEIDDALASGMLDEAEQLQDEHDALVQQLAQAFGLGGRSRRASSAAERARLNVTRAIRSAISTICEAHPAAGASLDRTIRTGRYCVHDPGTAQIRWVVQSGVNETGVG